MAETVDSLMNLEDRIRNSLRKAMEEKDSEFEKECRARLEIVTKSIARKIESGLGGKQ